MMQIGPKGVALLHSFEKCILRAYDDKHPLRVLLPGDVIDGTLTIGWGHTGRNVYIGLIWTQEEADAQFKSDMAGAEFAVNRYVKAPLNQDQFDALVAFCYNIGAGHFSTSMVVHQLNIGLVDSAARHFLDWIKSGGKVMNGLIARRRAEYSLFTGKMAPEVPYVA